MAITTSTGETARVINLQIQRLNQPAPGRPRVTLADSTKAGSGDQITSRHNDATLRTDRGELVRNRHTWTVIDAQPDGALAVSHPQRGAVTLPASYAAQHVELGWAVTGYGNQGGTVDVGIAALEAGTTRNHAYVALTRGRHANHAYLPDSTGTSDPADQLANLIARPARGESALATHASLRGQAPSTTAAPQPRIPRAMSAWSARQQEPARQAPRMRM